MQAAGIDVVGFSNNHCFDYGKAGYDNSRAFFDSIGLTHAGATPDDTQPDVPPYTVITAENGKRSVSSPSPRFTAPKPRTAEC